MDAPRAVPSLSEQQITIALTIKNGLALDIAIRIGDTCVGQQYLLNNGAEFC
jgi:hypothetical protein